MNSGHLYNDEFFDYIERGSRASARRFVSLLIPALNPSSVLDVGCGRGAWLNEWKRAGVPSIHGIDGAYVNNTRILIDRSEFDAVDLSQPFDLGRRFDLVTSLEVAEHLPPATSKNFVASLVRHGDLILFSAAPLGQGGSITSTNGHSLTGRISFRSTVLRPSMSSVPICTTTLRSSLGTDTTLYFSRTLVHFIVCPKRIARAKF